MQLKLYVQKALKIQEEKKKGSIASFVSSYLSRSRGLMAHGLHTTLKSDALVKGLSGSFPNVLKLLHIDFKIKCYSTTCSSR